MGINERSYSDLSHDIDHQKLAAAAKTRTINMAVDLVKGAIRSLTDEDRKLVLKLTLRELSSTLTVHSSGGFLHSLFRR
jgi:hypothetical protein